MPAYRATRTPPGAPPSGGQLPTVRYQSNPMWPGITAGHDARCSCTWAWRNGRMELKVINALCTVREHGRAARGQALQAQAEAHRPRQAHDAGR